MPLTCGTNSPLSIKMLPLPNLLKVEFFANSWSPSSRGHPLPIPPPPSLTLPFLPLLRLSFAFYPSFCLASLPYFVLPFSFLTLVLLFKVMSRFLICMVCVHLLFTTMDHDMYHNNRYNYLMPTLWGVMYFIICFVFVFFSPCWLHMYYLN